MRNPPAVFLAPSPVGMHTPVPITGKVSPQKPNLDLLYASMDRAGSLRVKSLDESTCSSGYGSQDSRYIYITFGAIVDQGGQKSKEIFFKCHI